MTPDELVAAACPTVNELGWAFYFTPETAARAQELGLDVFQFYFLGRGGVLGDGEADVVISAFGYFNPAVVRAMWDSARAVLAPRQGAREFLECAHRYGRRHFSSVQGLGPFCEAAHAVVQAADIQGLPLFAGAAAEPLPDDLPARAQHLVTVLRELRGSAHLVSVVASGLSPQTAHWLKRPEMWTTFGWAESDAPTATDADRAALAAAEELTDRLVRPAYAVLDDGGAGALLSGLDGLRAATA